MQIKIFTVPITDNGLALEELNKFLRSHKVIECIQQLVNNPNGTIWCFCVKYIDANNSLQPDPSFRKKKDYKDELDEKTFKVFSSLRDIRKQIATEDAIPAYAVCTDEELSAMATLTEINRAGMLSIKGFGEKKFEKFGVRIVDRWQKNSNEAHG